MTSYHFIYFLLKLISINCCRFSLCVSSDRCHDRSRINSSDVQCRRAQLSVTSVYLTHFLAKTIFFRGYPRGVYITLGEEGLLLCSENGNPGEEGGGGLCEILSVVGIWIFSGTTQ